MGNTYCKHYQLPTVAALLRAGAPEFLRKRPIKIMAEGSGKAVQLDGSLQFEVQLETEDEKGKPATAVTTCEGQQKAEEPPKEEAASSPCHRCHHCNAHGCCYAGSPALCLAMGPQIEPPAGPMMPMGPPNGYMFPLPPMHGHDPRQTGRFPGPPPPLAALAMGSLEAPLHHHHAHMAPLMLPTMGPPQPFVPFPHEAPGLAYGQPHGSQAGSIMAGGAPGFPPSVFPGHTYPMEFSMGAFGPPAGPFEWPSGSCAPPGPHAGCGSGIQQPGSCAPPPPWPPFHCHPHGHMQQRHGGPCGPACSVGQLHMPVIPGSPSAPRQWIAHSAPPGPPHGLIQPQLDGTTASPGHCVHSAPPSGPWRRGTRHPDMQGGMEGGPPCPGHWQWVSAGAADRPGAAYEAGIAEPPPPQGMQTTEDHTVKAGCDIQGPSEVHGTFVGGELPPTVKALW